MGGREGSEFLQNQKTCAKVCRAVYRSLLFELEEVSSALSYFMFFQAEQALETICDGGFADSCWEVQWWYSRSV